MQTSKEFLDKLTSDPGFAAEINETVIREVGAECQDVDLIKDTLIKTANAKGFELTGTDIDEIRNRNISELSEEELGKVSGGCTPFLLISLSLATAGSVFITLQGAGDD